jgi:molecular chaperone GrpE
MSPEEQQLAEQQQVEEQEPVDGVHETAEPAEPDAAEEVEHDLDELLARAGKADEYLALAQRTQADFENFRKRMARDVAAAETRGVARLAKELLPALDNLGRALAAAEAPAAVDPEQPEHHLTSGIRLVHDELLAALQRVGIEPFSPQGERFDPNEHEAMAQQPVDGAEPGTVVEVYQQGFRHGESVLRPARVVVAA